MQSYQLLCQQLPMIPLSIRMFQLHARRLCLCRGVLHVPFTLYPIDHICGAFVGDFGLLWLTMNKRWLTLHMVKIPTKVVKGSQLYLLHRIAAAAIGLLVLTIKACRLIQLILLYRSYCNGVEEGPRSLCVNPF